LDLKITRGEKGEFLLHHSPGATSTAMDYAPTQTSLAANKNLRFAPNGGRPANGAWPYYNLEFDGGGMIVVGWPGQWASQFKRDAGRGLHILAGQELVNLKLHPGEAIRSPRIVIQHYRGNWIRSQNIWRRWMMAHNMPRPGGKLPQPKLLSFSGRMYCEMCLANEANQLMCIDRYLEEGIKLDYWWMDAGWYKQGGGQGNWPIVGTWEVDTTRFPRGLRAVSDHAHSKGMKTVLWFEPERVHPATWLAKKRPQWLILDVPANQSKPDYAKGILLDLGNPEARQWLTDHVDRILTEQGIDLYRQDFNMDPLGHWRKNDTPDRQGITENKHVVGYLKFWDDLAARHPNLLIDSCASGGRRNELEAMRRAVPLWRSDFAYPVVANQCMSYGISLWIPYHGTGVTACATTAYHGAGQTPVEPYAFWSTATPAICLTLDIREKGIDYPALVSLIKQWREAGQYYYGDYYPLLPYTHDTKAWIAWQFHDAEKNEGMVEAFRRSASETDTMQLKLHDLKPECQYVVTYLDSKKSQEASGLKLMSDGLTVKIAAKPGVAVLVYKQKQNEK
ncbi:MAG: alpha-galactosidase, partial [Pirellulales bacterium]|nr:alpha-galactosidase [Pirellulales bacterium]